MEHIKQHIQQRLRQRKLYRPALGLVVKELLKPFAYKPNDLQIKLWKTRCTVVLSSQEDKPQWFMKKAEYLSFINKKLADDGRIVQFDELRIG